MSADAPAVPPSLPVTAHAGWQAYHAMLASKTAYFDFLAALDRKTLAGGQRTLAEIAHLDSRLREHTEAVGCFRTAMANLAASDLAARDALVAVIGELNQTLGVEPKPRLH
ncbi:MAG: hypothetical protein EXR86_11540 [Gammaproteobacteria bacterium]|nr:hypothetical protein [Gammaproteobacteria bacterium]